MNKVTLKNGKTYGLVNPLRHGEPVVRAFNADTQRWVKSAKVLEEVIAAHVEQSHTEALEKNALIDEQMKPKNYGYRPSFRIMSAVERKMFLNFAHDEALEMNQKRDTWAQVSDLMVKHSTPYAMDAVHAEALEMDAERDHEIALRMNAAHDSSWRELATPGAFEELPTQGMKIKAVNAAHAEALEDDVKYHVAIKIIADNLTLPVWDGCSDTVKREVVKTHHAEALEINESLQLAPVTSFSIWQRSDGMQLAVNAEGTASFMRPFKQASWLRAGFEANLEYYWLVEKGVSINTQPSEVAFFHDGVLTTCPV
ncbi:hypothetical protein PL246_09725 [Salmonella enterica]|uniref:hypothetical protein n=1 Tax=Salmonella enterica TaxID=28901 RepID=UPI0018D12590|nr:hypothetical protein [Salmonella enterica]MBH0365753.1 hypothetical protein [Salmonella enterica]MBH0484101.1 hypothetical protein [Salmonella enterica]MBH5273516.1 hypothetical protein [Salmonella enterica]MBH5281953.1 hypothetical protein [Salmonella enterica]MDO3888181.1 hypothetical protein [Salmonella enterica]